MQQRAARTEASERPEGRAGPVPPGVLRRFSVRDQVLDALRTALLAGELTPGRLYSAPSLAERFGVSATPVREAMQRLASEGAVHVVPNRGFRIAQPSARDAAELAEVRALLEVPAILRLTRTVPARHWAALRPLADSATLAAANGDVAGYADADRAFHGAVLGLSGNSQLVVVAEELHRRSQWSPTADHGQRDLVADAAEHAALLSALASGDAATAESVVRAHFA
ncbi:GntR family transcriptional regulator [Streptomyces sp. NPDC057702]|uniref:GntR family transcriptional regulator n=1 Tax=unclassified Streptomyces TaxID=2593676 RepID=UPI0036877D91